MFHDEPVEAVVTVHRKRTHTSAQLIELYQLREVIDFIYNHNLRCCDHHHLHHSDGEATQMEAKGEPAAAAAAATTTTTASTCATDCGCSGAAPETKTCCSPSSSSNNNNKVRFFLRIALQFPDTMLADAVDVVALLNRLLQEQNPARYAAMLQHIAAAAAASAAQQAREKEAAAGAGGVSAAARAAQAALHLDNPHAPQHTPRFYVLADTTFAPCCPDEVTAQHYMTDVIVHFGEACRSRTSRMPVFYVEPPFSVDEGASCPVWQHVDGTPFSADETDAAVRDDTTYKNKKEIQTILHGEVVLSLVERVQQQLQRRLTRWQQQQEAEDGNVSGTRVDLVLVGSYPTEHIMAYAQSAYAKKYPATTTTTTTATTASVRVCWSAFHDAHHPPSHHDAAAPRTDVIENATCSCWTVSGVLVPRPTTRIAATRKEKHSEEEEGALPAVQLYLTLLPQTLEESFFLSLEDIASYNTHHYTEAQKELLQALIDNDQGEGEAGEALQLATIMSLSSSVLHQPDKTTATLTLRLPSAPMSEAERAQAQADIQAWLATDHPEAPPPSLCDSPALYTAARLYHRRLLQRSFHVESIRASSSVGILVASLAIAGYRELTELLAYTLRHLLGKRSVYTIYVGHLNEFKLANFVDTVDCFVGISCVNSRECYFPEKSRDHYLKPIVSPAEVLLAYYGGREEEKEDEANRGGTAAAEHKRSHRPFAFTNHFDEVLQELRPLVAGHRAALAAAARQAGTTTVSTTDAAAAARLASYKPVSCDSTALLQHSAAFQSSGITGGRQEQDRRIAAALPQTQAALERFYDRSYVGLDPQIGQTAVQQELEDGRHGIARGYATEREQQKAPPPPEVK